MSMESEIKFIQTNLEGSTYNKLLIFMWSDCMTDFTISMLAKKLSVSRTAIRNSLKELIARGIVGQSRMGYYKFKGIQL